MERLSTLLDARSLSGGGEACRRMADGLVARVNQLRPRRDARTDRPKAAPAG